MTILNETKPPLEEALVHYGVPGMRWGKRKAQERSAADEYSEMADLERQERHDRNKRILAGSALAAVGAVATVAVLHKTGHVTISPEIIAKGKATATFLKGKLAEEKNDPLKKAKDAGEKISDASKKASDTFNTTENPIPNWPKGGFSARKSDSRAKKLYEEAMAAKAGFKNPFETGDVFGPYSKKSKERDDINDMFDVMFSRGTYKVHTMDDDIWDVPMLAITSGRKK